MRILLNETTNEWGAVTPRQYAIGSYNCPLYFLKGSLEAMNEGIKAELCHNSSIRATDNEIRLCAKLILLAQIRDITG